MNTGKKVNEALPETPARLQQMYFAIFNALKTDENLVNFSSLPEERTNKEVKAPTLTWLLLC